MEFKYFYIYKTCSPDQLKERSKELSKENSVIHNNKTIKLYYDYLLKNEAGELYLDISVTKLNEKTRAITNASASVNEGDFMYSYMAENQDLPIISNIIYSNNLLSNSKKVSRTIINNNNSDFEIRELRIY